MANESFDRLVITPLYPARFFFAESLKTLLLKHLLDSTRDSSLQNIEHQRFARENIANTSLRCSFELLNAEALFPYPAWYESA